MNAPLLKERTRKATSKGHQGNSPSPRTSKERILEGRLLLPTAQVRLRARFRESFLTRIELLSAISRKRKGSPALSFKTSLRLRTLFDFLFLALAGKACVKADSPLKVIRMETHRKTCLIELSANFSKLAKRVYQELLKIPPGKTISYKRLAEICHTSPRAVGAILARNPYPLLIPCHRVIGADGSLRGYTAKASRRGVSTSLSGASNEKAMGVRLKAVLLDAESTFQKEFPSNKDSPSPSPFR